MWTLQNDSADSRRNSSGTGGSTPDWETERGRIPSGSQTVRNNEHPDADVVQGRGAGEARDRGHAKEGALERAGAGTLVTGLQGLDPEGFRAIKTGECGSRVADVRKRLAKLGFPVPERDVYDEHFSEAVKRFQASRGIAETGICDWITWSSLVEAGFKIGDRVLYLRRPYFRGDDVAWLQMRLGNLGFDPGRVDGIFGPKTYEAVKEFQANVALPTDGICGPTTIEELRRVYGRSDEHVHALIERVQLQLISKRPSEAKLGCLAPLVLEPVAELLAQRLRASGAHCVPLVSQEQSILAGLANKSVLDLVAYLDYCPTGAVVAYYSGFRYSSSVGKELALRVAHELKERRICGPITVRGMSLPVLRETRMPAVLVALSNAHDWQFAGSEVADGVAKAMLGFLTEPEHLVVQNGQSSRI